MIVNDGHLGRMVMVQMLGGLCVKQKVRVHKLFHNRKYVFKFYFCLQMYGLFFAHSQKYAIFALIFFIYLQSAKRLP